MDSICTGVQRNADAAQCRRSDAKRVSGVRNAEPAVRSRWQPVSNLHRQTLRLSTASGTAFRRGRPPEMPFSVRPSEILVHVLPGGSHEDWQP